MENRFGIKDFFLYLLVLVGIGLLVLNMVQVDRQWKTLQDLSRTSDEHTRDLVKIEGALDRGVTVGVSAQTPAVDTTAATTQAAADDPALRDPFRLIREAEKMPGFARGDWFVDNLRAKVKALTPFIGNDIPAAIVQKRIFDTLIYFDVDTLQFMPLLARTWTISPDGKTITIELRHGVSWSDGEPFTADDVVFTFDWIRNKDVKAPRERSYLDKLISVEKNGDYEVIFKFSEYNFRSLDTIGNDDIIIPKHFYSKYTPEQFNESVGLMLGTGPYRLADPTSWRPGTPIVLQRNERYWGVPPAPARMVFLELEEESAWQTTFTNGDLDFMECMPEQFDMLKKDPRAMAIGQPLAFTYMMGGYNYVGWNQRRGGKPTIFADKRVRQAMTMLIDRQRICDQVLLGYATVPHGTFAPGSAEEDPDIKPWPYDPARAKRILAELGYTDRDGSGILSDAQGRRFQFTLTYPNKLEVYDRITSIIKDNLAQGGIQMDRDPIEWPVLLERLDRSDFDAISLAWSADILEDPSQMFASSQIADQGDNRESYINPELDAAMEAAKTCVDDAKRNEIWHKVDRIIADDCPYTFLDSRKQTVFVANRWQNVRLAKMGLNINRYDTAPFPWFVPLSGQKYHEP